MLDLHDTDNDYFSANGKDIVYFRMQAGDWIIAELYSQDTEENSLIVKSPYRIMYMWDTNISSMVRRLLPLDYGNPKGRVRIFSDCVDIVPEYLPEELLAEYTAITLGEEEKQSAH